ncbi:hypothetical protein Tcan_01575, partial [Toxocara canis]
SFCSDVYFVRWCSLLSPHQRHCEYFCFRDLECFLFRPFRLLARYQSSSAFWNILTTKLAMLSFPTLCAATNPWLIAIHQVVFRCFVKEFHLPLVTAFKLTVENTTSIFSSQLCASAKQSYSFRDNDVPN